MEDKKDLSEAEEKSLKAAIEDWKKSAGFDVPLKEAAAPSKPAADAKAGG